MKMLKRNAATLFNCSNDDELINEVLFLGVLSLERRSKLDGKRLRSAGSKATEKCVSEGDQQVTSN